MKHKKLLSVFLAVFLVMGMLPSQLITYAVDRDQQNGDSYAQENAPDLLPDGSGEETSSKSTGENVTDRNLTGENSTGENATNENLTGGNLTGENVTNENLTEKNPTEESLSEEDPADGQDVRKLTVKCTETSNGQTVEGSETEYRYYIGFFADISDDGTFSPDQVTAFTLTPGSEREFDVPAGTERDIAVSDSETIHISRYSFFIGWENAFGYSAAMQVEGDLTANLDGSCTLTGETGTVEFINTCEGKLLTIGNDGSTVEGTGGRTVSASIPTTYFLYAYTGDSRQPHPLNNGSDFAFGEFKFTRTIEHSHEYSYAEVSVKPGESISAVLPETVYGSSVHYFIKVRGSDFYSECTGAKMNGAPADLEHSDRSWWYQTSPFELSEDTAFTTEFTYHYLDVPVSLDIQAADGHTLPDECLNREYTVFVTCEELAGTVVDGRTYDENGKLTLTLRSGETVNLLFPQSTWDFEVDVQKNLNLMATVCSWNSQGLNREYNIVKDQPAYCHLTTDSRHLEENPNANDIAVELVYRENSVSFTVTNDGSSVKSADIALHMNGFYCYAFTKESEDWENGIRREDPFHDGNSAAFSLEPGESVQITACPDQYGYYSYDYFTGDITFVRSDYELSWMLIPNYEEGYSVELSGDTIGQWDSQNDPVSITVTKTAVDNVGDRTAFHSVTDLREMVAGQHYIFAVRDDESGNYYALAYDGNCYIRPVELNESNGSYTLDVSEQDIKEGNYVLTSTSEGTVSENQASGQKFRTNDKDPVTGKKIYLKMGGNDGGYHAMFATGGGEMTIRKNSDNDFYTVIHDKNIELRYVPEQAPDLSYTPYTPTKFTWFESSGYKNSTDIIILTDANVTLPELPGGKQAFSRIYTRELSDSINVDTPLLFAYKAPDGSYYALTSDGNAAPIPTPTGDPGAEIVITDAGNAWIPQSLPVSRSWRTPHCYCFTGLKQGEKYLDPAKEDLTAETPQEVWLAAEYSDDIQSQHISIDGWTNPLITNSSVDDWQWENQQLIGWDDTNKKFVRVNDGRQAIQFELYAYRPESVNRDYYRIYDLSQIEDWSRILITTAEDENGRRSVILPSKNSGYSHLGFVPVSGDESSTVHYTAGGNAISAPGTFGATRGTLRSSDTKKYKLTALRWKELGRALYLDDNQYLLANEDKECMLTYAEGSDDIILRGAKRWLRYDEDSSYEPVASVASQEDATPVEIWALYTPKSVPVQVTFHYADDTAKTYAVSGSLALPDQQTVRHEEKDYAFVGWTNDPTQPKFLSLDDSCDLYDYDDATGVGSIKESVKDKYGLMGHCNPEEPDSINPGDYDEGGVLNLYPVYAVKGYSSAVTAKEEDGTGIIGISDWKDLEPGDHSQIDREKWLGRIYVNVYKDGELWVNSAPMYFRYHNDDAADVNLKFISDELMKNYQDQADPLYAYLSDQNAFPETAQDGGYVIDAVYAHQGGSEDGLKYVYNWLTDHGGQLDNIEGGSTIDIYVTSVYRVKYYLDDVLLTDSHWTNPHSYTTPGTDKAFGKQATGANYLVRMDNEFKALMDRSITDNSTFVDEAIKRGDYSRFAYDIHNYDHTIPLAKLPDAPSGKVLTASTWAMKDPAGQVLETPLPLSDYGVTGTVYKTGNTKNAWQDEADQFPTYHLYAYSKEPSGGSGGKTPPPDTPDEPDQPVTPALPDGPDRPVSPDRPDTPAAPETPAAPDTTQRMDVPRLPQTGQPRRPFGFLLIAGLSLTMMGRRRRTVPVNEQ